MPAPGRRVAGGKKIHHEFDADARALDHGLSDQYVGACDDPRPPVHTNSELTPVMGQARRPARRLELNRRLPLTQVKKLSKAPSRRWLSAAYVPGDFVLVEHLPDRRQKSGELLGELGIVFCCVGEHHGESRHRRCSSAMRRTTSEGARPPVADEDGTCLCAVPRCVRPCCKQSVTNLDAEHRVTKGKKPTAVETSWRAPACKVPRHSWQLWHLWYFGICNLQKPKSLIGFESHPLRA